MAVAVTSPLVNPVAYRRRLFTVAGSLLGLFVVLAAAVAARWSPVITLDRRVGVPAQSWVSERERVADVLMLLADISGPVPVRSVMLVVALWMLWRGSPRIAVWIVTAGLVSLVASPLLKQAFDRPRPVWDDPITVVSGLSFPSGHATGAGVFAATAVVLTRLTVRSHGTRRALNALWLLTALVIGLHRIGLGVHNLSDVVAGWSLGAAVALLLAAVMLAWRPPQTGPAPTTTLARPSRLAVVLNPTKVPDVADFTSMLTEAALRHGWQLPTFHQTTAEDAGVSMTEAALAEGSDMVLVAGGDGTVRVVCAELARTGVPVGIVPLGTGNLLARNLQLPLRAADAVEVALSGHDRAIDVVEVTGDGLPQTAFTVMAGIGFDAAIMAGASETLKAQLGWRAYVVSGLRNLRYPARRVEVSVDDGPFVRHRARTVIIGNVGLLQAGIPLLPDARFDDGRLDVVVVAPQRTLGWLLIAVRVLRRARHTDDKLARMTGSTVVVRASQPQARQLDGDPIEEGTELRCRVLAGTLLVRVPR